jgi:thiol-disulfide isomerase/thioredoxin
MRPVRYCRAVVASFVLAAIATACGDGGGVGASGGAQGSSVPAANAAEAALLPTDALALPDLDVAGFERLLGQLEGTPVVVNVWGSWCEPCREEAPHLAAAHREFGDRVQFLGVDILDARESARAFMREHGWTYPSVFDPPGSIRDALGLLGQPVTVFYDASGRVVDRWVGPIPVGELRGRLEELV